MTLFHSGSRPGGLSSHQRISAATTGNISSLRPAGSISNRSYNGLADVYFLGNVFFCTIIIKKCIRLSCYHVHCCVLRWCKLSLDFKQYGNLFASRLYSSCDYAKRQKIGREHGCRYQHIDCSWWPEETTLVCEHHTVVAHTYIL